MVTIHDVAKRAGVSAATVSYSLNNKNRVNDETKERIRKIADELGYIPNSLAQGLLNKKTNTIGLVLPDISNSFDAALIKYLEGYARKRSYFLIIANSAQDEQIEMEIVKRFVSKNADAIALIPRIDFQTKAYQEIATLCRKRNIPLVFLNQKVEGVKANVVAPDIEEGEYMITNYLLEKGLRDIAFVGGDHKSYFTEARYKGFIRALQEFGVQFDPERYIRLEGTYSFDHGYESITEYLKANKQIPEGIVAINDNIAMGVYKGLKEKGIRVPEDVSLVGYDDLKIPSLDDFGLSTIKIPLDEIAKFCIEILDECIQNNSIQKQYIVKPKLIIRQSVKD